MPPDLDLDFQPLWRGETPEEVQFYNWAKRTLKAVCKARATPSQRQSLCIRILGTEAMQTLNERYRKKPNPTNVLAFEATSPPGLPDDVAFTLLGDIALCGPLVLSEADEQSKTLEAHWALLTVHGVLHLLGYDHQSTADWRSMTAMESDILTSLGLPDPWRLNC